MVHRSSASSHACLVQFCCLVLPITLMPCTCSPLQSIEQVLVLCVCCAVTLPRPSRCWRGARTSWRSSCRACLPRSDRPRSPPSSRPARTAPRQVLPAGLCSSPVACLSWSAYNMTRTNRNHWSKAGLRQRLLSVVFSVSEKGASPCIYCTVHRSPTPLGARLPGPRTPGSQTVHRTPQYTAFRSQPGLRTCQTRSSEMDIELTM